MFLGLFGKNRRRLFCASNHLITLQGDHMITRNAQNPESHRMLNAWDGLPPGLLRRSTVLQYHTTSIVLLLLPWKKKKKHETYRQQGSPAKDPPPPTALPNGRGTTLGRAPSCPFDSARPRHHRRYLPCRHKNVKNKKDNVKIIYSYTDFF